MLIPVTVVGGGGGRRRDGRQVHLSLAQIHTIMAPPRSGEMARITDVLGNEWEATEDAFEKVCFPVVGTLPAEKDTFIVIADRDTPKDKYRIMFRFPVLGWIADRTGEATPVLASGMGTIKNDEWGILYPNGNIEIPFYRIYEDENEWLTDINRRISKKREQDLIG